LRIIVFSFAYRGSRRDWRGVWEIIVVLVIEWERRANRSGQIQRSKSQRGIPYSVSYPTLLFYYLLFCILLVYFCYLSFSLSGLVTGFHVITLLYFTYFSLLCLLLHCLAYFLVLFKINIIYINFCSTAFVP